MILLVVVCPRTWHDGCLLPPVSGNQQRETAMLTIEQSGFFNGDRVELDDIADYFTVENMSIMFPGECDGLTQDECDECAAEARTMIETRNAEEQAEKTVSAQAAG